MDNDIKKWVKKQLDNGENPSFLKKVLENRGHDPEIVEELLHKVPSEKPVKKEIKKTKEKYEKIKKDKEIPQKKERKIVDIKEESIKEIQSQNLKRNVLKIAKIVIPLVLIILIANFGMGKLEERSLELPQEDYEAVGNTLIRLEMDGSSSEEIFLKEGWWPSAASIRWGGNDNKYPTLEFQVEPNKEYEIISKLFVPSALSKKRIDIIVNGKVIKKFSVGEEGEKIVGVDIPSKLIKDNSLIITFKSGFWNPSNLNRQQTIAFDYVILTEK